MQRQDLVDLVRDMLRLQNPEVETDKAYVFTDEQLEKIVEMKISELNPNYSLKTLPKSLEPIIMVMCRKEIYWRLATSSAPFYPISAEGASLFKNVRFDHYIQLIKLAEDEFKFLVSEGGNAQIEVGNIFVDRNYYTSRNRLMLDTPTAFISIDKTKETIIELSWEIPNLDRTKVEVMNLYISKEPIVDEYNSNSINPKAIAIKKIRNAKVDKARITDLESGVDYYIALEVIELNGNRSVSEITTMIPVKLEDISTGEVTP